MSNAVIWSMSWRYVLIFMEFWCCEQPYIVEGINTEFEVMAVTPQTSNFCDVTVMTENEVSISVLSWYHEINFKSGDVAKPNCLSVVQV